MSGRLSGNMLKVGGGQACQGYSCLNQIPHHNLLVNQGIYCTPHFITSLNSYCALNSNDIHDKYHLILQCRARPRSIKIPSGCTDYWVVN